MRKWWRKINEHWYQKGHPGGCPFAFALRWGSVFLVANVLLFCRVKRKIADGSNQTVNSKGNHRKKEICSGSAGKAHRLELRMIDNDASNPS